MQDNKFQSLTLKDDAYPVVKYKLPIGDTTTKCNPRAHDDLIDAVRELDIHLAILTGQLPMPSENTAFGGLIAEYTEEIELDASLKRLLNNIMCSGFTLDSSSSKVVLHGTRSLDNAKTIHLESPEQNFEQDTYDYPYIDELSQTIEKCKYELSEYLEKGKVWVNPQGDLFNEEQNQVVLETATKKKGRKKKAEAEDNVADAVLDFIKKMDEIGAEVIWDADKAKEDE
jgi:hypothetical protein